VCLCVFLFVGGFQLLVVGVGQVKTNHHQNQASSLTPLPSFLPSSSLRLGRLRLATAKEVSRVENDFFLAWVPIMDHQAPYLTGKSFTTPHRFGGHAWNIGALGPYMKENKNLPMLKRISDFNVLLLSAKVLDPQSVKAICNCVVKQEELEDGYAMILGSLGM
jgi:hypothetical protein